MKSFRQHAALEALEERRLFAQTIDLAAPLTVVSSSPGEAETAAPLTAAAVPQGWAGTNVGYNAVAGSTQYSNGTFTVKGGGIDIGGTADQFHFAHRGLAGNGQVVARLTGIANTSSSAKAGVMLRETTRADSRMAALVLTPGGSLILMVRTATGRAATVSTLSTKAIPQWLRIVRSGSTFSFQTSSDGRAWSQVGSASISMNSTTQAGMSVTSRLSRVLNTSTFDSVTITAGTVTSPTPTPPPPTTPPPSSTALPAGWSANSVGYNKVEGSTSYSNGTFTLRGGGIDIGATADQFHFASRSLSGNGHVVARVTGIANTDSAAKAGIMLRETSSASSKMAGLMLTPGGNLLSIVRSTTGKAAVITTLSRKSLPQWLKIVRSGGTFTFHTSADGAAWTQVGSAGVTMTSTVLAGMGVTSRVPTVLNTSSFDNVSVTSGTVTNPPPPPTENPTPAPGIQQSIVTGSTATYVRGGTYGSRNFGSSPELIVRRSSASDSNYETYLKFDLSAVRSIASAKLRLYGRLSSTADSSLTINVHSAGNTSWSESTLTYSNRPAAGSVRASLKVSGTSSRWYEVDLSGLLRDEQAAGRKIVTLVLKGSSSTGAHAVFSSDEASSNRPNLLLRTMSPDLASLQRAFLARKYGMFIHFGYHTFTDNNSTLPPDVNRFNPSGVNTDQWAAVAKASGMTYGVLTTKHHIGYPLWDSNQTGYDVASSKWYRNEVAAGRSGDIVRRYVDSFRRQGLGVGFYYSISDRHGGISAGSNATWATNYVKAELTQLLKNYGPIQVLWTDGWGWSVGYNAVRWQEVYEHIKTISPNTLVMENNHERTLAHTDILSWENPITGMVSSGNRTVAELSDTIRSDGSWHYRTFNPPLRDTQTLLNSRRTANARSANYLLNVGPNRSGLIPQVEIDRLDDVQDAYLAGM